MGNNNQNNNNLSFLDVLTVFSVVLQLVGYQNDMSQSSNDDLMREIHRQNKKYLEQIIENQKEILNKLAELG